MFKCNVAPFLRHRVFWQADETVPVSICACFIRDIFQEYGFPIIALRFGIIGFCQRQGILFGLYLSIARLTLHEIDARKPEMRIKVAMIVSDRCLKIGFGQIGAVQVQVGSTALEVGFGKVRVQVNGFVQVIDDFRIRVQT